MSFLSWLANGMGTLLGVVNEAVTTVIDTVRSSYEAYLRRGGAAKQSADDEFRLKKERLREVNEEIMQLRNRSMSSGGLNDQERRRWEKLR